MADSEITVGNLLLREYDGIKEEQRARIAFRDNLLYATLAAMAGVVVATLQARGQPAMLLLLPPVSVVLGWTYLVNDEKVSAIGRYIRDDLAPRLVALLPAGSPEPARVLGWETAHRTDDRRTMRKSLQLGVDLILFGAAPLVALVVYWLVGSLTPVLLGVSIVETAGVLLLAALIVRYADLRR